MQKRSVFNAPTTRPFTLGAVMPGEFERYVRILEPGLSENLDEYISWTNIAMNNSRVAHSLMQWEGITGASEIQPANIPGLGRIHPILTGHISNDVFNHLVSLAFQNQRTSDVYACIWEGWANDTYPPDGIEFQYRNRSYRKYLTKLGDIAEFNSEYGPVSILWPTDESWCVYNDIDTIDTFVGGSQPLIETIKAIPEIETFDASASQAFDVSSDQINIIDI